jgi:hypothetical protein
MHSFRVVVPTRDSARWVGVFLNAYRRLGVEPFFVVDSRSADDTLALLRRMNADLRVFTPGGDYVEAGMIEFAAATCGADWVLRFDDDEFPTRALLQWAAAATRSLNQVWAISRRELFRAESAVYYSRSPGRFDSPFAPRLLYPQFRLFHRRRVVFSQRVHTPGFDDPRYFGFAPGEVYFAHFNCLLRTPAERLSKIRKYESIEPLSTWRFGDDYLPELFDVTTHHDGRRDGLGQFDDLLAALPLVAPGTPDLSNEERALMGREVAAFCARMRAMRDAEPAPHDRVDRLSIFARLPQALQRKFAEALLTLGRGRARQLGLQLWNFAAFRREFDL